MYVRFSRKKKVNRSEHILLGRQRPGGRSSANGVQLFGKQDGRHFRGKEAGRNAVEPNIRFAQFACHRPGEGVERALRGCVGG